MKRAVVLDHSLVWRRDCPSLDLTPALLHEEVLQHARRAAARIALTDVATGRAITFGALAENAPRLARGLALRGAQAGDMAALVAGNCIEFPIAMHGALAAGVAVTPANPLLTARELRNQFDRTKARYVVAAPSALPAVREGAAQSTLPPEVICTESGYGETCLEELLAAESVQRPSLDVRANALVFMSSGTTALPKSAAWGHHALVTTLRQLSAAAHISLCPEDVVGLILPFPHVFGTFMMNHALQSMARIVSLPSFNLEPFLHMIEQHRVTVTIVTPPVALALARQPIVDRYDLSSLRLVLIGAAPCSTEVEVECEKRLGCVVGQGFGLSEGAPLALPADPVVHGSAGRLVASTEAMVVDPVSGARVGAGKTGELWFRAPQMMSGYIDDEPSTAETIDRDGWLHTGDVGYFDDAGNLFVVDRLKELIKYRGYHVAPAELEAELVTHPAVADAAVVSRPDVEAGELPVAYVVLREPANTREIARWLARRVAPYKRVWDVLAIEQIPRSPTGKILRRVLRERERERRHE
jgi:acyl-CoA synthetase (AMP-forming)/AMP-acid ligase II